MTISLVNGVNPLQTTLLELGIVSGRVALLLRSAEIQPVFGRFVPNGTAIHPPQHPLGKSMLPAGRGVGVNVDKVQSPHTAWEPLAQLSGFGLKAR